MTKLVLWLNLQKVFQRDINSADRIGLREDGALLWGRNIPDIPPPPPIGKWIEQVASADKMNNWDTMYSWYGLDKGIAQGSTHYFLIDPKGFGIAKGGWTAIRVGIRNSYQTGLMEISPVLYKLTTNCDELASYQVPGSVDFLLSGICFADAEYNSGVKYLLEIKEKGLGSGQVTVYWNWDTSGPK